MTLGAALVSTFVLVRQGNLGYDHSAYLANAVKIVRNSLASDAPLAAIVRGLDAITWKPPLFTAWLALGSDLLPALPNPSLLLWATVLPFLATSALVYMVCLRLGGSRAGLMGLLVYGGSVCTMSLVCHIMVETTLSLFVLLSLCLLASLSLRPRVSVAAVAGVASGLGMMTKISFAAFLSAPVVFVFGMFLIKGPKRRGLMLAATFGVGVLLIALPWYARNWQTAVAYAQWCSDFPRMLGYEAMLTPWFRIKSIFFELLGMGAVVAASIALLAGKTTVAPMNAAKREFTVLFALAIVPMAILELAFSFYEARHLMPIVPAFAVLTGLFVDSRIGRHPNPRVGWSCWLALAAGVAVSIFTVSQERISKTDWRMIQVLDEIGDDRREMTAGVIGGSYDWNTQKFELFDILGRGPRFRFAEFSTFAFLAPDWKNRLRACDMVIIVEQLDQDIQQLAPKLNDAVSRAIDVAKESGFVPLVHPRATECSGVAFMVQRTGN